MIVYEHILGCPNDGTDMCETHKMLLISSAS